MKKSNLIIAVIFHLIILFIIIFFAAKEGKLGQTFKSLTVVLSPKQKIEEVKPKTVEPKLPDVPKVNVPQIQEEKQVVKSKSSEPTVAPNVVQLPSFDFFDGAKKINSTNDPIELYRLYLESNIKSAWQVPDNDGVVNAEITIDSKGKITSTKILNFTDLIWEMSVSQALSKIEKFSKEPPTNFPKRFTIRFDIVNE